MTHTFKITREEEQNGCWMFEVALESEDEPTPIRLHQLRLSWEDYDLWVRDGTVEPSAVGLAVLKYLQTLGDLAELPDRIDSSYPRRRCSRADEAIPGLIDPVMFRGH